MFVKKRHRPLPSQFGGSSVKPWCGVVVEAVLRTGINIGGVRHIGGFQGGFVGGPSGVDAFG